MSRKAKPPQEPTSDALDPHLLEVFSAGPSRWVEPDIEQVGRLTAMRSLLEWARLQADWFHQVDVAAVTATQPETAENQALLGLARCLFDQSIEVILNRWRHWFPNDPPPELPKFGETRYGTDAHRVVDKARGHLKALEKENEANWAKINGARDRMMAKTQPPPLLERACAVLTPAQAVIFKLLWERKSASYDALLNTPRAFQDGVTDEAVTKQLKEIKRRLEEINLPVGYMEISTTKRSVRLTN